MARSRLFCIEDLELEFSNGTVCNYERLTASYNGAVLVIPLLDNDTVLMIREYAAGTHQYELGLPKGKIDDGEHELDAANRELQEETGYASNQLEHLQSITIAPGYLGYKTHIILARDLYPSNAEGDEPEPIEVIPWKLSELDQLMVRDDFTEARSMLALYLVRDKLASESVK